MALRGTLSQILVLLSFAVCGHSLPTSHVVFGKCPTFPVFTSFDQSQFQGSWGVAYQFDLPKFIRCQNLTFTVTSDSIMAIDGRARVNYRTMLEHSGRSTTPSKDIPGVMNWSWNYFAAITDHVTVIDTDYINYAILVVCNDFGLLHVNYAILLTREKRGNSTSSLTLYVERAASVLGNVLPNLKQISHSDCGDQYYAPIENRKTYNVDEVMQRVSDVFSYIFE